MAAQVRSQNINLPAQTAPAPLTKPCYTLITLIALLALGLVVTGILAVVAAFPAGASGLGVMNQIGWKVGAALIALGLVTLTAVVIYSVLRFRLVAKQEESKTQPPSSYIPPKKVPSTPSQEESLKKMTDAEILALPLLQIQNFSEPERAVVINRLILLDKKGLILPWQEALPAGQLTLADLRAMQNVKEILKAPIPPFAFSLLSTAQLTRLLATHKIDALTHTNCSL